MSQGQSILGFDSGRWLARILGACWEDPLRPPHRGAVRFVTLLLYEIDICPARGARQSIPIQRPGPGANPAELVDVIKYRFGM